MKKNPNKKYMATRPGKIILLSAPSRGGKNAVIAELIKDRSLKLCQIITCTTRPRRDFEVNHVHYHFITLSKFRALIRAGALLEWAEFNGHLYGTPRTAVEKTIAVGKNPLLIIEVRGARQVMKKFPGQTLSIFLKPASLDVLRTRFADDKNFTPAMIRSRLAKASSEIRQSKIYDYVVMNKQGKLPETVKKVKSILTSTRL